MGCNRSRPKSGSGKTPPQPVSPKNDKVVTIKSANSGQSSPRSSSSSENVNRKWNNLCPPELKEQGYTIDNLIATGSFSKVYTATYKPPKEQRVLKLAVKIIKFSDVPREWRERSYPNERYITSIIKHPNIIEIQGMFATESRAYIFMELASNTVTEYLNKRKGYLSEQRVRYWFKQLLFAVEYLHHRKIAHRDLKTDNLILDRNDNLKLTDFGFACFVTDQESKKPKLNATNCGTFEYMAPEVTEQSVYDAQLSDMWSCGIILYELLTKKLPFQRLTNPNDEKSRNNIIERQMNQKWNFPTDLFVTVEVKDLTKSLLQPVPTRRPDATDALRHPWFKLDAESKLPGMKKKLSKTISKEKQTMEKPINQKRINK